MKSLFIILWLCLGAIYVHAQNYNPEQRTMLAEISDYLEQKGLNPERQSDGLRFKSRGRAYQLVLAVENETPMFLCVRQYVKYSKSLNKASVSRRLNDCNSTYGIKVLCREDCIVISAEMFLRQASDFIGIWDDLRVQMEGVYNDLLG